MSDKKIFTLDEAVQHERGLFNLEGQHDAINAWVCKQIGEKLARTYPGHPWGVMSEVEHGIAKIMLQGFSQWVITIRLATLKSDPGLTSVMRYAGELLERLKLPRSGFDLARHREAMQRYPHHFYRNAPAPE